MGVGFTLGVSYWFALSLLLGEILFLDCTNYRNASLLADHTELGTNTNFAFKQLKEMRCWLIHTPDHRNLSATPRHTYTLTRELQITLPQQSCKLPSYFLAGPTKTNNTQLQSQTHFLPSPLWIYFGYICISPVDMAQQWDSSGTHGCESVSMSTESILHCSQQS